MVEEKDTKDQRTYSIIGAAMEVHSVMGSGLLEAVYQECLEIEFSQKKIPFIAQPVVDLFYKGIKLKKFYVPDFIVFDEVVIEIKAEKRLTREDEAQIINTLKNTGKKTGLLINFGESSLKYKRFIN
jgi:GxxExxY protein